MKQTLLLILLMSALAPAIAAKYPQCLDPIRARTEYIQFPARLDVAKGDIDNAIKDYRAVIEKVDADLVQLRKHGAGEIEIGQKREMLLGGADGRAIDAQFPKLGSEFQVRLLLMKKLESLVEDKAIRERIGCEVAIETFEFVAQARDKTNQLIRLIENERALLRQTYDEQTRSVGRAGE